MAFLETFGLVTYASMGGWHAAVTKGLNVYAVYVSAMMHSLSKNL